MMLGEVNAGYDAGRILFWLILLAGALKYWSISRRPTTNRKCALALILVLLAMVLDGLGKMMLRERPGPATGLGLAGVLLSWGMVAALVGSMVLAILGLVEVAREPQTYKQGRAQAIWALVIAGLFIAGWALSRK